MSLTTPACVEGQTGKVAGRLRCCSVLSPTQLLMRQHHHPQYDNTNTPVVLLLTRLKAQPYKLAYPLLFKRQWITGVNCIITLSQTL